MQCCFNTQKNCTPTEMSNFSFFWVYSTIQSAPNCYLSDMMVKSLQFFTWVTICLTEGHVSPGFPKQSCQLLRSGPNSSSTRHMSNHQHQGQFYTSASCWLPVFRKKCSTRVYTTYTVLDIDCMIWLMHLSGTHLQIWQLLSSHCQVYNMNPRNDSL